MYDTENLTSAELLAEIGLGPHAIRDILGDDETRTRRCPDREMPPRHAVGETGTPLQHALHEASLAPAAWFAARK